MAGSSIGEVVRQTDLSAPTLRYYEQIGLLPPVDRWPESVRTTGPYLSAWR